MKEERKDEDVTPKSEPATAEIKEESSNQDVGDQESDDLHEELQRRIEEFPPHDSEDSLGPEHVADELRRLATQFTPIVESAPQHEPRGGATAPEAFWEDNGPYAPTKSRRHRGRPVSPDPLTFHTTIWLEDDREASARAHAEPIEQLRDQVSTLCQGGILPLVLWSIACGC